MATDSSRRSNRCREIAFSASIDSCPGNLFNALSQACSADLVFPSFPIHTPIDVCQLLVFLSHACTVSNLSWNLRLHAPWHSRHPMLRKSVVVCDPSPRHAAQLEARGTIVHARPTKTQGEFLLR